MLYSMTGFGRAEKTMRDKTFLVELKSLNGKQYDIRLILPALLRPYEFRIRNQIFDTLLRGSIECVITVKQNGAQRAISINTELAKHFYTTIKNIADDLRADKENILSAVLKLPEVVENSTEALGEEDYQFFSEALKEALQQLNMHRKNEGEALEKDLLLRVNNIEKLQPAIAAAEPNRRVKIKEELVKMLSENVGKENYDKNRLEQELIYYIEKIDINEEQTRLKNHCEYFKETLNEPGISKGKKLGFILQEMGREINTTGAKAYDIDIQRCVVEMKDELEKAKEQAMNIL
jgi:uncharacterized protein (TIGR00255 family)